METTSQIEYDPGETLDAYANEGYGPWLVGYFFLFLMILGAVQAFRTRGE